MTHRELCLIGAKWIKNCKRYDIRRDYVVVEMVCSARETADIFAFSGWNKGQVLIEVKVSRADFLAEKKKDARRNNDGIGVFRYYLCPEGLINQHELPDGWGLLFYTQRGIEVVCDARAQEKVDYPGHHSVLYSIIRRIMKPQVIDFRKEKGGEE